MPPWTYREMEKEFNRRQMQGEPCEDLVRMMVAVLTRPPLVARMDVKPDGGGLALAAPVEQGEAA